MKLKKIRIESNGKTATFRTSRTNPWEMSDFELSMASLLSVDEVEELSDGALVLKTRGRKDKYVPRAQVAVVGDAQ